MGAGSTRPSVPRPDWMFQLIGFIILVWIARGPAMIARLLAPFALLAVLALPAQAQDKDVGAGLEAAEILSAVVRVRAKILPNARSAQTLGLQREGSGVLVRDGYVVTIGYLVIESETIEVTGADGKSVPATLAGYDHASGFGLVRLLAPLAGKPLLIGDSAALDERDLVLVAGHGGREAVSVVQVISRRAFSGSWEYLLESAIWTYPAVPNWSGAPLIGPKGDFLGIGSLIVGDAAGAGVPSPGNLFVPADLLRPILKDLIAVGRSSAPVRPWLGINAEEIGGHLMVARVSPEGPADVAGVKAGDILIGVGEEPVSTLAEFYRKVWARGAAGVQIPLRFLQGAQVKDLKLRSIDRATHFRQRQSF
ncbi:MAG: serine protease [Betaproteobacteria bacterium]|nr:serine protease [Betaproteobacteria bacterium]